MLRILTESNAAGHTVIIVTHDMSVAQHTQRIIEIRDGEIVADRATTTSEPAKVALAELVIEASRPWQGYVDRCREALHMALLAMNAHRLRTFLTMLGIVIGIAAVVSVVTLGEGSRRKILSDISAIGTNTISIFSGKGFGDEKASTIYTLVPGDAQALVQQDYVESVTPGFEPIHPCATEIYR